VPKPFCFLPGRGHLRESTARGVGATPVFQQPARRAAHGPWKPSPQAAGGLNPISPDRPPPSKPLKQHQGSLWLPVPRRGPAGEPDRKVEFICGTFCWPPSPTDQLPAPVLEALAVRGWRSGPGVYVPVSTTRAQATRSLRGLRRGRHASPASNRCWRLGHSPGLQLHLPCPRRAACAAAVWCDVLNNFSATAPFPCWPDLAHAWACALESSPHHRKPCELVGLHYPPVAQPAAALRQRCP